MSFRKQRVLVIGAGPAGLTAAYELSGSDDFEVLVVESLDRPGGISRTVEYRGYKYDIGGHRFFTKNSEVKNLWKKILGKDFLTRKRKSRIFYKGKFYNYPLSFGNALRNLGIVASICSLASYIRYRIAPIRPEKSYEDWMTNRFGKRLFNTFFKTYTEKVWGIPVNEISKDWASQRVKQLSLFTAVIDSIFKRERKGRHTTLTDTFHYPKYGPGQMWDSFAQCVEKQGAQIRYNCSVSELHHEKKGWKVMVGDIYQEFDIVISTMPLRSLVYALSNVPEDIRTRSQELNYRDFLIVLLVVNKETLFDDNWIYIHEPSVKVGRIQNFKNWSEHLVPDTSTTSIGMEYFCFEHDGMWEMSDANLLELAKEEFASLGFCAKSEIIDGTVLRVPKAYPVYDKGYKKTVKAIRTFLKTQDQLFTVGRNGMHKYNNQDHSMVTALLVARNILGNEHKDPWKVNSQALYHEENYERLTPQSI